MRKSQRKKRYRNRKRPGVINHARIEAIRAACTPEEFQEIERRVTENSQPNGKYGWTSEEVARGDAHKATLLAIRGIEEGFSDEIDSL
jgi:hypothetical protein